MKTFSQLKKLAVSVGCEVEDDRDNATLYIHALDDKAWEGGALTSLVHPYGSFGSYIPAWRIKAISEAYERLEECGAPDSPAAEI